MAGESAFKVVGVVVEVLPRQTYRVKLLNGHRLLAFVPMRQSKEFAGLKSGETVKLQMSPGDLSQGRIIVGTKQI
jgi:translation initiation factor IF-1